MNIFHGCTESLHPQHNLSQLEQQNPLASDKQTVILFSSGMYDDVNVKYVQSWYLTSRLWFYDSLQGSMKRGMGSDDIDSPHLLGGLQVVNEVRVGLMKCYINNSNNAISAVSAELSGECPEEWAEHWRLNYTTMVKRVRWICVAGFTWLNQICNHSSFLF